MSVAPVRYAPGWPLPRAWLAGYDKARTGTIGGMPASVVEQWVAPKVTTT